MLVTHILAPEAKSIHSKVQPGCPPESGLEASLSPEAPLLLIWPGQAGSSWKKMSVTTLETKPARQEDNGTDGVAEIP